MRKSTTVIDRIQAMGVTPRRDDEAWYAYLRRVEVTYQYLKTGVVHV